MSGQITAGSARLVNITFTPAVAVDYLEIATIRSPAAGNKIFALSGRGYLPRLIDVSGDLSFGRVPVGASVRAILRVINVGSTPLTVARVNYPLSFSGDWPGGVISPGTERHVAVTFALTETNIYSGQIEVVSDATSGPTAVAVNGVGLILKFKSAHLLQTGTAQVLVRMDKPENQTVLLETSDDLLVWGGARVLRGLGPSVDLTEQINPTNRARFYRMFIR